jgi:hypothetical protein
MTKKLFVSLVDPIHEETGLVQVRDKNINSLVKKHKKAKRSLTRVQKQERTNFKQFKKHSGNLPVDILNDVLVFLTTREICSSFIPANKQLHAIAWDTLRSRNLFTVRVFRYAYMNNYAHLFRELLDETEIEHSSCASDSAVKGCYRDALLKSLSLEHVEIISLLLEYKKISNLTGYQSEFCNIVLKGGDKCEEIAHLFLRDKSFDVPFCFITSLNLRMVQILLESGRSTLTVNNTIQTYCLRAVNEDNVAVIPCLLKLDFNPSFEDSRLLKSAIKQERYSIMKLLLDDIRVIISVDLLELACRQHTKAAELIYTHPRASFEPSEINSIFLTVCKLYGLLREDLLRMIQLLLNDERMDTAIIQQAFNTAVTDSKLELVNILLNDTRVNPSLNNNSAIKIAFQLTKKKKLSARQILTTLQKHPRVKLSKEEQSQYSMGNV